MLRRRRERPVILTPRQSSGRVPPHDLDAEAVVLSAIMLEPEALDKVVRILRPEHFYSEANRRIYEAALDLAEIGSPVDGLTVMAWLRSREWLASIGGVGYLAQITDSTPAVAHVDAHARIVAAKYRVRSMIATNQRIEAEGYGDIGDTREWLEASAQAVYAITEDVQSVRRSAHVAEAMKVAWDEIHRGADPKTIRIRTGLDKLDDVTTGPQIGDVWIVAGRPGIGKTSAVLSMALNMAADEERPYFNPETHRDETVMVPGVGVLIQSLEMPREQLALRLSIMESGIDMQRARLMRAGRGSLDPNDWPKLEQATRWIGSLPLWIDDTPGVDLMQLRATIRKHQTICKRMKRTEIGPGGQPIEVNPWELRVVVVDYLQLMKGAANSQNREQEIAGITRGLKEMAKEFGVAVLALSQLNRLVETRSTKDKRPQLSDLRESGAIEQDADTILLLYRDSYYNKESKHPTVAEIDVAKQRNGPTERVLVKFVASTTKFTNLPPSEYPRETS